MNNFTIKKVLLIIALALLPMSMIAQKVEKKTTRQNPANYWFINVDGGGTMLFGDNKPFQFNKMKFNGRIGAGYNFCKHFQAYVDFNRGFLAGDYDKAYKNECDYYGYNANISIDLVSLLGGYKAGAHFGVRLHGGVGQVQIKSKTTLQNGITYSYGYKVSADANKGKGINGRKIAFEVPVGLMLNYDVSRIIDIYVDFTGVFCDTDALDGYQHGKHKDFYATGNVGVRFKFVKKQPKPIVKEEPVVQEVVQEPVQEPVVVKPEPVKEVVQKPVVVKSEPVYTEKSFSVDFSKNNSMIAEDVDKSLSEFINSIGDARITSIKIVGCASPEGKDEFNKVIARERANSAKEYLIQQLGSRADGVRFDVSSVGADWDGFIKAVWDSNIKEKDTIIGKLNVSDYKANTLWKLSLEYPKVKELYPPLRRADIIITVVKE